MSVTTMTIIYSCENLWCWRERALGYKQFYPMGSPKVPQNRLFAQFFFLRAPDRWDEEWNNIKHSDWVIYPRSNICYSCIWCGYWLYLCWKSNSFWCTSHYGKFLPRMWKNRQRWKAVLYLLCMSTMTWMLMFKECNQSWENIVNILKVGAGEKQYLKTLELEFPVLLFHDSVIIIWALNGMFHLQIIRHVCSNFSLFPPSGSAGRGGKSHAQTRVRKHFVKASKYMPQWHTLTKWY